MLYKYKGMDRSGKRLKGTISATSEDEAKQKLKSQGIFYESLKESRDFSLGFTMKKDMSGTLLSNFSRELSSYIGSGMTIATALKLMENQHKDEKSYLSFLNDIRTSVEEGQQLYSAIESQNVYRLPDFFLHSLKVAGESGKMADVLANMGHFFSMQNRVRKQVVNAMAYPLFIFVVAMGMTGFLISFVVPKITGIFQDTGQELPKVTQFVLGLSDFLSHYWMALLIGFIIFIVLFKVAYSRLDSFRLFIDTMILRVPVLGDLIQNHELGRFSYILSLMLDSGVSYAQAVQLASTTFSNEALQKIFTQAASRVVEGNKLSNALNASKGLKPKRNFLQSLALGEESSEVASVLFNLSRLYAEENEDRMKMLLSMLEPVMMLLIGAIVGTIVTAMLLPIFSMNLGAKI